MREIKSENAQTVEEFYQEAKGMLRDWGVPDPTVGEPATVDIPDSGDFKVHHMKVYEVTRPGQKALNAFPRRGKERVVNRAYDKPICNIFGCNLTQLLNIECVKTEEEFVDPEIDAVDIPVEITDATAYLNPLNARVEGTMEVNAENNSEPGEKITTKEYKCKDEKERDVEIVDGSATLDFQAEHDVTVVSENEFLDTINSNTTEVAPGVDMDSSAPFEKTGTLQTLRSIVDVWRTGTMRASVRGLFDVNFNWRGSMATRRFNVDTGLDIPVTGNLNVSW